jgi:hypothetical protein
VEKPNVNEEVLKQVEAYVQDKYAFNEAEYNRMKKAMNEAQFAFLATLAALEAYNKPLADVLRAEALRCGWRI